MKNVLSLVLGLVLLSSVSFAAQTTVSPEAGFSFTDYSESERGSEAEWRQAEVRGKLNVEMTFESKNLVGADVYSTISSLNSEFEDGAYFMGGSVYAGHTIHLKKNYSVRLTGGLAGRDRHEEFRDFKGVWGPEVRMTASRKFNNDTSGSAYVWFRPTSRDWNTIEVRNRDLAVGGLYEFSNTAMRMEFSSENFGESTLRAKSTVFSVSLMRRI